MESNNLQSEDNKNDVTIEEMIDAVNTIAEDVESMQIAQSDDGDKTSLQDNSPGSQSLNQSTSSIDADLDGKPIIADDLAASVGSDSKKTKGGDTCSCGKSFVIKVKDDDCNVQIRLCLECQYGTLEIRHSSENSCLLCLDGYPADGICSCPLDLTSDVAAKIGEDNFKPLLTRAVFKSLEGPIRSFLNADIETGATLEGVITSAAEALPFTWNDLLYMRR